jgi:hypothetical protein
MHGRRCLSFCCRYRTRRRGTYGYDLARIASTGFYNFSIQSSDSRSVTLDLRNPIEPAACIAAGNCNPDRDLVVGGNLGLATAVSRFKPLVGSGLSELSGLLWGMNCTGRYSAKVHYSFTLPSANGHWGFNFNRADYPGSTDAFITRVNAQQWIVESSGQIVSFSVGLTVGCGARSQARATRLLLRQFQFTIDVAALAIPERRLPVTTRRSSGKQLPVALPGRVVPVLLPPGLL